MKDLKQLQEMIPRYLPTWPVWLTATICLVLILAAFTLDLIQPLGVAGGVPYIAVVLISSFAGHRTLTVACTLVSILFIVLGFHLSPAGGAEPWIDSINRTQAITIVVIIAAVLIHRISVLQQRDLMMDELSNAIAQIKLLHGLLPICASCKKIKTDTGDWHQLESYIQEHSGAEFTHGICNDCADSLYHDFVDNHANGPKPDAAQRAARAAKAEREQEETPKA